ncbi:MAG TPA: M10 family metallopeptidase C-terminal domain-containing protein [Sphingopyxis sp.]|nr:M10 family metallopeptidase C-terminal domain-containing protein [Sphingopyxis sp.]
MCSICDKLGLYSNLTSDPRGSLGFLPSSIGLESGALTIGINEVTGFDSDVALQYRLIDGVLGTAPGFVPDNYQPVESAWYIPGPTALIDVYAPNPSTTGTLVVDDPNHIIAACDTPGDNDWFAVTLTAGQTYEFGQYAYAGGIPGAEGNGVPLADAYLELYDSAGNLLSVADGGGPNTPSGLDALMTFQATYSGTYYVNATSYDNDGDGIGDFVGDYELFARTATGTVYTTEYDISSPLHSIDWGGVRVNREHVSVENPDGQEGPRPTGDPAADPADVEGNALGFPGKNVIYLYFAGEGDLYANADSTIPAQVVVQNPYQYEVQAMLTAANEFSKVADVVFVSNYTFNASTGLYERNANIEYKPGPLGPEAGKQYATGVEGDGFDADFFYFSYPGTPGPVISLLGSMSPPDYGDEGTAQFNSADERWNAQMLQPGGFSFVTLIHEFGHGMGLAHPHDTGGGSSVMQGVETNGVPGDDGGAGAFDLNQGVNTMMSYNDGWEKSPYGQPETNNEGYGWLSSLMALDIAVIQDKYGVNEDWATGNDTYVLKDVNAWGVYIDSATGQPAVHDATNAATARDGYYVGESTSYSSIWDAGGTDQIVYSGARDTNIDLRAATLQYEYGGAGWMSYATGIYGGYTIANGVTIENAFSGSGNDTLIGNDVANILVAGAGNDNLDGGLGRDVLIGQDGDDYLFGGFGDANEIYGGAGNDTYEVRVAGDTLIENPNEGSDTVRTTLASYTLKADFENLVNIGTGTFTGTGNAAANIMVGNVGRDYLHGLDGADYLVGGANDDSLFGGTGAANTLEGGLGDDTYYVNVAGDSLIEYAGQGNDAVVTTLNYYVLGTNLETLIFNGSGNFAGVGNAAANRIEGGHGNDLISGGLGADVLLGHGGVDDFLFDSALGGGNVDTLADFLVGTDRIFLEDSVFTGLATGALAAGAFATGSAATEADDRIIYDATTGALYFDADGVGGAAAIQFAQLNPGLELTAASFAVI